MCSLCDLQHFSEQMEDLSNDLFSSFFDDHLLAERHPLLDMELDPPNPAIQAEHSYSLSGDSAPQSPSMPIKMDEEAGQTSYFDDMLITPYVLFCLVFRACRLLGSYISALHL